MNMGTTLVAVLSQKEMKLFDRDLATGGLKFQQRLENEICDERSSDISRHRPGAINEGGAGVARHIMDAGTDPHEVASKQFAHKVADFLDHERSEGRLSQLIVVAEPRFLGRIRSEMADGLKKITTCWVDKDLDKAPTSVLESTINRSLA
jgi:protein required for attachment to host cells